MTLLPRASAIPFADQEVVPAQVPLPPVLLDQVTRVTPTESDAVPDKATTPVFVKYVELVVGEVIATDGGVVS